MLRVSCDLTWLHQMRSDRIDAPDGRQHSLHAQRSPRLPYITLCARTAQPRLAIGGSRSTSPEAMPEARRYGLFWENAAAGFGAPTRGRLPGEQISLATNYLQVGWWL